MVKSGIAWQRSKGDGRINALSHSRASACGSKRCDLCIDMGLRVRPIKRLMLAKKGEAWEHFVSVERFVEVEAQRNIGESTFSMSAYYEMTTGRKHCET